MKEKLMKMREEKDGFTLAELLIVVAIIAVLVAIAIPVFTSSLHASQEATDEANARSFYADCQAKFLTDSANRVDVAETTVAVGDSLTFDNGDKAELLVGTVTYKCDKDNGYTVTWTCASDGNTMTWGAQ